MHRLLFVRMALALFAPIAFFAATSRADETLRIDFARPIGQIRPLHGINCGPVCDGGMVDLTEFYQELRVPLVRLHDCHWPNPDVVDVHTIFPDFDADPDDPASYRFAKTDEYVAATLATGAQIVFRLGESIDHGRIKEHVHPPRDPEKWAAVCLGIVRHYNDGWASGFRHDIRYWEIWNEPENRPAMWSGTDEDYFRLYAVTSRALKERYPDSKIGGPAVGATGSIENGAYRPTPFVVEFLETCRRENLPLDFFSWHCYADDPQELVVRAKGVRRELDERGFATTESHLNEWNYLPDGDWSPLTPSGQGEPRKRWYERTTGAEGAAFAATALIALQDAPVDATNFYRGEIGGFSAFDWFGGPTKAFFGLKAFSMSLDTPQRCAVEGGKDGIAALAGIDAERTRATVIITLRSGEPFTQRVEIAGLPPGREYRWTVSLVDGERSLRPVASGVSRETSLELDVPLSAPCVAVLRLDAADTR
jgi:hypothetical protein